MNLSLLEIFTNSVDPDETLLNVAAHQALTRLICHISTERQLFRMVLVRDVTIHRTIDISQ